MPFAFRQMGLHVDRLQHSRRIAQTSATMRLWEAGSRRVFHDAMLATDSNEPALR